MDTNEQLLTSMQNMGRLIRREVFLRKDCSQDFSHSEIEVMFFLKEKKTATMRAIADHLRVKPASVTPVIEKMFKKKMLSRTPDKKDRRIIYISLTKSGLKTFIEKQKEMHKHIKKFFQKISEKNKKELLRIINTIVKDYE
jgi:DNA-binding MarR family transcriptional regulator